MINQETKKLIESATSASLSFYSLLQKLEADHYIYRKGKNGITDEILPELGSYCLAILELFWEKPAEEISTIFCCISNAKENSNDLLRSTKNKFLNEWNENKEKLIVPGGYDILCRFDAMAQEYDGALYSRMKVNNPGRLTTFYLDLMDSYFEILTRICNVAGNAPIPNNWEQTLSELKSAMLERQMEILL